MGVIWLIKHYFYIKFFFFKALSSLTVWYEIVSLGLISFKPLQRNAFEEETKSRQD